VSVFVRIRWKRPGMHGDLPIKLYDMDAGKAGDSTNPGASAQSRYTLGVNLHRKI
jgi:hypothetical protein